MATKKKVNNMCYMCEEVHDHTGHSILTYFTCTRGAYKGGGGLYSGECNCTWRPSAALVKKVMLKIKGNDGAQKVALEGKY